VLSFHCRLYFYTISLTRDWFFPPFPCKASKDVLTQKLSERSEGRAAAPEVTALKSTESAADSKSKAINSEDRKKDFKKGYSSGGSSLGLMRDENSSRSQLDVLHLSSMRDLAAENGLTQAVVRLEVRR